MEIFHIWYLLYISVLIWWHQHTREDRDTHLSGGGKPQYEAHGADPECDGALPAPQSCRPDGDDALDDGVEDSEALGDSQEDKDEVEEDGPERGDHLKWIIIIK